MCKRLIYLILVFAVLGPCAVQGQEYEWIRAAYWDGRYPGAWGGGGEGMRDALAAAGYEILDADQLKTWMDARIADKELSVVVFCKDVVPDTVGETMSDTCTLRRYLNAGGKIVWYADWPFYYQGAADNTMVTWGGGGATAVLGFNASTGPNDSYNVVTLTDDGIRWGLTQTWESRRPTSPTVTSNLTVLAVDDGGVAAAWVKHYVAGDTFRGFVRFYDTSGMPDPEDVMRVAEYIILKASNPDPPDGAVGVTAPLLTWAPGPFALWHDVYFGTTPELGPDTLVAPRQPFNLYFHISGLQDGTTYYWRVDAIEADGTIRTGDVWTFTSEPLKAFAPNPADGAEGLFPGVSLNWLGGKGAVEHRVYFGSDAAAVTAGDASVDQGTTEELTFPSGLLRASTTYYWRIDEIKLDGSVESGDVWSFTTADGAENKIVRQWWTNLAGTAVSVLTGSADYPNNPTGQELVDLFEGPVDWSDNYGTRLYGWLKPPQTGAYTFWIAGDDEQQLWLSTDEDPANAVEIANVPGWTPARDFDNTGGGAGDAAAQQSDPITLQAGRKYYIEALGKEGGGGDNISVAWQIPGGTREVIPGQYVDAFALPPLAAFGPTPLNGAVDTTQDPTLTWGAGENAVAHQFYLGEDADAVAAADTSSPEYKGEQPGTAYITGPLAWGKTYYWRVDEKEADGTIRRGPVWSFTTADYLSIDDMESYDDNIEAGTAIYQTWIDGFENNTGSLVGYLEAIGGTFGETTIVHGGRQSMPLEYDNAISPYYSEAERTWATPQDWTVGGVTDLVMYVQGYPVATSVDLSPIGGAMSVTGDGRDIWDNSDEFTYAYRTLNGDGTMVARVVSIGPGTNTWAKGGVMIRESLNGGSAHAMMVLTANSDGAAGNGASFQYRAATDGGSANDDSVSVIAPPYWVKIERMGDTFSGYVSADGNFWSTLGSTIIAMEDPVYIGICVTSHEVGEDRTFEFDNISSTGSVSGQWQGLIISAPRQNSTQPLYVVVQDSAGRTGLVPHPDPAAVNVTEWTEWRIPLSELAAANVNLSAIKKMIIGIGNRDNPVPDGTGLIFIDDIRTIVVEPTP